MDIQVKKFSPKAKIPSYKNPDDAGLDLYAVSPTYIQKGDRVTINTGIGVNIPKGYVGLIWDKSGLSHKKGLKVIGGVIDSGYIGEILIGMVNLNSHDLWLEADKSIAQLLIQPIKRVELKEVKEFPKTVRGESKHGSAEHAKEVTEEFTG